jgi:hypothetical protein
MGEILDVGIKIYTRNWLTLWKIVVFVVFPAQILINAVYVSAQPTNTPVVNQGPGGFRVQGTLGSHDVAVVGVGGTVAVLVGILAGQLAQAGCLRAITDAYLGEQATWRGSLRYALRRLPAVFLISLFVTVLSFLGLILCIVPGVYLWAAYFVAIPVLLIEGSGPIKSLGRSRRLVKGFWWRTFGVAVVGALLVAIVSAALTAVVVGVVFAHPARDTATGFVLNTLASTVGAMLTTPAAAAFATVLYIDLRVRKEGFDLLLLARGLGSETGVAPPSPTFIPAAPAYRPTQEQPPYWPPPPGWTPGPAPEPALEPSTPPPEAPAKTNQPPYWPPPPGWKPDQE